MTKSTLDKLSNWVQLLTAIAMLIGVGLVIWELRSNREIARAQQAVDGFGTFSQRNQSIMGEEATRAFAKACEEPDNLSVEEMIIMHYFLVATLNNMRQSLSAEKVSSDLAVNKWEQWQGNFRTIFATEYGRWWWKQGGWEPELREAGDRILAGYEIRPCIERFESYRNRKSSK